MTEQSKKRSQRRPGGMLGHVRAEQSVMIAGIRTARVNEIGGAVGIAATVKKSKLALSALTLNSVNLLSQLQATEE